MELSQGFSSYEAYKLDKQDSVDFLPRVSPPFEETIAPASLVEAPNGKVYFYSFARRPKMCGYTLEEGEPYCEIYRQDLDTLSPQSLRLVDSNSIPDLVQEITSTQEGVFVSIGLQEAKTANKVLLLFTNVLYRNSPKNVWKVRRILSQEMRLLN